MKICSNCGASTLISNVKYCDQCGTQYPKEQPLPRVGKYISHGAYRITFPPQEAEFESEDVAQDAAMNSWWDENREFEGEVTVEEVSNVTTPETHPFECAICKADESRVNVVSETDQGRCIDCSNVNWVRRSD